MSKKPNIRFKEFSDDWEQRKVTDLGEIYIGLVTTMTEHYTDKGHLLIRNSDIKDGYFEFGENPIYLDEEFSEQNKSRMHQLGDVITVHTGDIGTSAVIGENEVNSIGFATIVTRPNQDVLDSNYFATYLNTDTHKQWAVSMATGDGRSNYNLKDYTKLVVPVPKMEEQKKIATCVGTLNSLITLHQCKCDKLKELKKHMLKKMFPKNNEKFPEYRFDGFTDPWEQRKLGEVATFINGRAYSQDELLDEGKYKVLRVGNFYTNDSWYYSDLELPDKFYAQEGDLLYTWSATFGPHIWHGNKVIYHYHIWKVELSDKLDKTFTLQLLEEDKANILANKNGSTMVHITKEGMEQKQISIPSSVQEQAQIGAYFEQLDSLITLHQRKVDNLKIFKKFMLKKMFI